MRIYILKDLNIEEGSVEKVMYLSYEGTDNPYRTYPKGVFVWNSVPKLTFMN